MSFIPIVFSKEWFEGEKVTYFNRDKVERGIVKKDSDTDNIFVVYSCNDDWDNYQKYTAAATNKKFLLLGWFNDEDAEELRLWKNELNYGKLD